MSENHDNIVSDSKPLQKCQFITAFNNSWTVTKWQIIDASTSQSIYTSGKFTRGETLCFDPGTISGLMDNGVTYYFKANVESGSDSTANIALQFTPSVANTVFFSLTGTAFNTTLKYST